MRQMCHLCQVRQTRGAHNQCESCWFAFVVAHRQDWTCPCCNKRFDSYADFKWHEFDINNGSIGVAFCKKCSRANSKTRNVVRQLSGTSSRPYLERLRAEGVPEHVISKIMENLYLRLAGYTAQIAKERNLGGGIGRPDHAKRRILGALLVENNLRHIAEKWKLPFAKKEKKGETAVEATPQESAECFFCDEVKPIVEWMPNRGPVCKECAELYLLS